ncbi:hypothetical protein HanIR_Chr03g0127251 [Helianthus annuus]|nr:hypothetical protein HanIR_Chr03g0127251 [Helianthus annuus]
MRWQISNDRTCGIAHMQGLENASFVRFLSHLSSFIVPQSKTLTISYTDVSQTLNSQLLIHAILCSIQRSGDLDFCFVLLHSNP